MHFNVLKFCSIFYNLIIFLQVNRFIENQRIRIKKLFIDDQPKGHHTFTEEHNLKSENGTKIHITTNEMQQQD